MGSTMANRGPEEKILPVRNRLDLDEYILTAKEAPKIIPESDLRTLTQGPLKRLLLEPGNYEKSLSLWRCLFHTLEDATLPIPHQASVCNAVCAFLEAALTAKGLEVCQFARSEKTWLAVFEIYLDRFEYSPPKPMKQILATLTNILATHSDPDTAGSIRSYLIDSVVKTILLAEPLTRLKASVVSLHFLIRKEAFPAVDLITHLQRWLQANVNSWTPVIGEHAANIGLDISTFAGSQPSASGKEQGTITAQLLCLVLLLHLQNANVVTSSGALLSQLCFKLKKESEEGRFQYSTPGNGAPFWAAPLKYLSLRNLDNLDATISLAFHLLFRGQPAEFSSFLDVLPLNDLISENYGETGTAEFALLIAVLETGKELGLVHEDQAPNSSSPDKLLVLESQKLRLLLIHSNAKIRVRVLSLLISAPSTTKPFSSDALLILKEMLPFIHAEADAHVRSELVSLIRKLTVRLRGGSSTCPLAPGADATDHESAHLDAQSFVSWYIDFLQSELRPNASYQTHILALKALATIIQSGLDPRIDPAKLSKIGSDQRNWPFSRDIFTLSLFRALGDLLINPYEEIRMTSLTLLGLFPASFLRPQITADTNPGINGGTPSHPYTQLLDALARAEEMAGQTSRADHADGVARIYHFLFDLANTGRCPGQQIIVYDYKYDMVDSILTKLEKVTSLSDITTLRNTPIHGHLSALRYIMASPNFHSLISSDNDSEPAWRHVLNRTLLLCETMWSDVQAVLCVDSPEREHGNSSVDLLGPKDILSCCWRALRESSLLLNAILSNTSFAPLGTQEGLNYDEFARIGSLTFSQLAELRHRGAFSAVSQTFVSCCQRCSVSKDNAVAELPQTWFKEILSTIYGQSAKLTRRSAGLPALALGVASSAKRQFFHEIMEKLQDIAKIPPTSVSEQVDVRLPQVHAMNCLKDIFTATNLATVTEEYLMPALSISAECLGSEIWAIRNCGLMLFRSLVQRMCRRTNGVNLGFGVPNDSEPKQLIPFQRFPGLIPLLTGLLEKGAAKGSSDNTLSEQLSITTERVFPALELIGNKFPSPASSEDERILESVSWQFDSPVWGIRDHAARTYASLVDRDDILSVILKLSEASIQGQNQLHGIALCIKYLLRRICAAPVAYYQSLLPAIVSTTEPMFTNLGRHVSSPFTLRELVEIINGLLQSGMTKGTEDTIVDHFDAISTSLHLEKHYQNIISNPKPGSPMERSSSLLLESIAFSYLMTGVLLKSSIDDLAQFIRTVSTVDVDVAASILGRFSIASFGHLSSRSDRLKLYCRIITDGLSKDTRLTAISSLSDELEAIQESAEESHADFSELDFLISWSSTLPISESLGEPLWGRKMTDATIRLQGCLHSLHIRQSPDILNSNSTVVERFNELVQQLSASMRDETVFTTRFAAVTSLNSLVIGLRAANVQFSETPILIDVMFVLYDMLNDDDVEIREAATLVASKALADDLTVFRLPAASASAIAALLTRQYAGSSRVFEGALQRFLGAPGQQRLCVPVAETLDKAINESTALFAEEKQNLYIDEVREIKLWSQHLVQLENAAINCSLYENFNTWVMDELDSLTQLAAEKPKDSLLGWASNIDVFVTGIRVLYGAKILLLTHRSVSIDVNTIELTNKLQALYTCTYTSELNPAWESLLEGLYTGGVNNMNLLIECLFSFFSCSCPLISIYHKDLVYRLSTSGLSRASSKMTENYVIVVLLLMTPLMILILWKVGRRILEAIRHGILLSRMQQEAQDEDAARIAQEIQQAEQLAELSAMMAAHRNCRHQPFQYRAPQPIQQPQPAHVAC
ncbi:Cell cycle-associated protein [Trichophyton interdigitale]|nr:Cell cycle-associated protein [Trichophyton interdigitale]